LGATDGKKDVEGKGVEGGPLMGGPKKKKKEGFEGPIKEQLCFRHAVQSEQKRSPTKGKRLWGSDSEKGKKTMGKSKPKERRGKGPRSQVESIQTKLKKGGAKSRNQAESPRTSNQAAKKKGNPKEKTTGTRLENRPRRENILTKREEVRGEDLWAAPTRATTESRGGTRWYLKKKESSQKRKKKGERFCEKGFRKQRGKRSSRESNSPSSRKESKEKR